MRYLLCSFIAALVFTVSGISAFAQDDERHKVEFYGGYSHERIDVGDTDFGEGTTTDTDGDTIGAHGFEAALVGNVHKYVGLKFDFSHHRKSVTETFDGSFSFKTKTRLNQFLGGVQFKNNKKEGSRVRPFMHVLAGVANLKVSFEESLSSEGTKTDFSDSSSHFAMAIGGGLDVRANKRVSVRLFQIDYNPVWVKFDDLDAFDGTSTGARTSTRFNNFRFGFGIVFH